METALEHKQTQELILAKTTRCVVATEILIRPNNSQANRCCMRSEISRAHALPLKVLSFSQVL